MKFVVQLILIVVISAVLQVYLPFWSVAIVAFLVSALTRSKSFTAFLSGFLAIFLLWFITAYWIDGDTQSILTHKISSLFSVSKTILMLITALIGGLVGGFGALTGSQFMQLFKSKTHGYYR